MNNQNLIVGRDSLLKNLESILSDYQIAALTQKQEKILYDYITKVEDILFDYQPTVLSPKKFFFPQDEVVVEYDSEGNVSAKTQAKPLVLFGIRPCDLNAFKMMYEAFADLHGDPNYLVKHDKAIVIGMDCKKICDEDAFCYKVQSQNALDGYDIMLYELGDTYAIETLTDKGRDFVKKYLTTKTGKGDEIETFKKEKEAAFANEKPFKNLENFPEIFEKNKKHEIWEKEGERCLSCGSCIMVCPTCYCFDMKDEMAGNLKTSQRIRSWDACMLDRFAVIASGENFRGAAVNRLHHRINRKYNFLMKKHGRSVCVGCGRCVRACLADISPKTIAEAIVEEE